MRGTSGGSRKGPDRSQPARNRARRLRPAHDLIEAEKKQLGEQIDRLLVDQAALRAKDDWISPEEARTWEEERVGLRGGGGSTRDA